MQDEQGHTPFYEIAMKLNLGWQHQNDNTLKILQLLINSGADVIIPDNEGISIEEFIGDEDSNILLEAARNIGVATSSSSSSSSRARFASEDWSDNDEDDESAWADLRK